MHEGGLFHSTDAREKLVMPAKYGEIIRQGAVPLSFFAQLILMELYCTLSKHWLKVETKRNATLSPSSLHFPISAATTTFGESPQTYAPPRDDQNYGNLERI